MSTPETSSGKQSINLNVISPSSAPICFRDLPISTSIADLKRKIWEASPIRPPPNVQKLIYRGHVITQPERILREVFPQELINAGETLTIHLITPPSNQQGPSPGPDRPPTTENTQNTEHRPRMVPHVQQVMFSATFNGQPTTVPLPQQQASASTGLLNGGEGQSHDNSGGGNPPQGTTGPTSAHPGPTAPMVPHFQAHINALQAQAQALLANQLATLQQHPAFLGQVPVTNGVGGPTSGPQPFLQPPPQNVVPADGLNNLSQSGVMPSIPRAPHAGPPGTSTLNAQNTVPQQSFSLNGTEASLPLPNAANLPQQHPESRARSPLPTFEPVINTSSRDRIPQVSVQSSSRPAFIIPNDHPAISRLHANSQTMNPSEPPTVYLLSSPSGPQALLVSPNGLFSTPWAMARPVGLPSTAMDPRQNHSIPLGTNAPQPPIAAASVSPIPVAQPQQPDGTGQVRGALRPDNNAAPLPANANQRDVGRLAAQVSSHIWMLIRLFGFIWFFSHGASTNRTIMLYVLGTLVFFGQAGLLQGLWRQIRGRADEILQLGGPGEANQANMNRGIDNNATTSGNPTPEQTAERLLAERQRQEGNAVRQALRRCERAAMLFFGSLAPGLAERHIQARNAAETARQRAVQENEEREKREAEERKAATSSSTDDTNSTPKPPVGGQRAEVTAPSIEV